MATDSQVWSRGPGSSEEGWLTPHHPGVEVACYGRLLLELGHQEDGRAALAQLHLARRAAVARFTDNPADPYAPQARLQQLDGWAAFVESKATGRFGFPRQQRWADKEVRIARTGKVGTTVPPL